MAGRVASDAKLRLAVLASILTIIDEEGESEVAWFNEELTTKELVRLFLCDGPKRLERLSALVCTFGDISAIMDVCEIIEEPSEVPYVGS